MSIHLKFLRGLHNCEYNTLDLAGGKRTVLCVWSKDAYIPGRPAVDTKFTGHRLFCPSGNPPAWLFLETVFPEALASFKNTVHWRALLDVRPLIYRFPLCESGWLIILWYSMYFCIIRVHSYLVESARIFANRRYKTTWGDCLSIKILAYSVADSTKCGCASKTFPS